MAQGPEKKFKAGAITAAIWKNQIQIKGNTVETRSVQLQRAYQDKDGNWQNTNSLQANDLPKAILLLQKRMNTSS